MPLLPPADESRIEALRADIRKVLLVLRGVDPSWHGDIRVRIAIKDGKLDFAGIEGANKTMKFDK